MHKTICSFVVAVALLSGCDKADEGAKSEATTTPEVEAPPSRQEIEEEVEAAADGPDCETFVAEVRQACQARFANGIDVDCHGYITKANTAIKQKSGKLFNDPTGKRDTTGAGDRMCATFGIDLREDVAAAKTIEASGEQCAALGEVLDAKCFAKIGTPEYPFSCSGPLIVVKRGGENLEKLCESQLIAFRSR